MLATENVRIDQLQAIASPEAIRQEIPLTPQAAATVTAARSEISRILHGQDPRLLVIVGPCSIHDPEAAIDYAKRLAPLAQQYADRLLIVMRVYFEKPRTTVGWKGLINDPHLDGSFAINEGLRAARSLLLQINELGLPTGTEFLDTIIPQYISDLIAWAAIGARTTESQIHRELASGLSMPVGFKNGTTGNTQIAVDAVLSAKNPHRFLGVTQSGQAAIVRTTGNSDCHVILRGSNQGPNYDVVTIEDVVQRLEKKQLPLKIMVDCSHGNSQKDFNRQKQVIAEIAERFAAQPERIMGVMIESNLVEGNQKLNPDAVLQYGQSITDACIGWEDTEVALRQLAQQ